MVEKTVSVGEKMDRLMKHFAMRPAAFADLLGIARPTLVAYLNGQAKPREQRTRDIAQRFGIPYGWFIDGQEIPLHIARDYEAAIEFANDPDNVDQLKDFYHQALRAYREREAAEGNLQPIHPDHLSFEEDDFAQGHMIAIPAWQGVLASENETHFIEEKRPRKIFVPPFFFSRKNPDRFIVGLPKGDSMAPRIVAPDRLIVLLASDAQPNSIVIARRIDGVNFVKIQRIDRMGKKELHSINPEFPPIVDLTGWIMKGVLVGIWKPYIDDGTNIEFNGGMPLRA